ncbi:EamA-like transporter family protein [Hymenobacter daecheongensis DSM 21074]|uniref:EamA-like transporter family protein n=1 Tax=Hymenobacter daecheongensis DSM 21074 TaxID=1121955 RepID=A0A1M6J7J9_9BACT|nr:EamA family transporter [Hymenobacter daecheongensis]SHJ42597.1 EamA-like transporter family protein [Hymenobacter daecheongensis DSM 21074]
MPSSSSAPSRAAIIGAFAIVYLVWGSTYLGIRYAIDSIPPLLMAGSRYLLAGLLLYSFMRLRGAPAPTWRGWGQALLIGICLLTFGNGGVTLGEQYISSGLAALLVAVVPLFLAVLGWLSGVSGRPTLPVAIGLLIGMVGVYLVARTPGVSHVALPGHETLGISLVLTAALLWAIGSLYAKKHQPASSPFVSGGMQMMCGGALMLLAGLVRGEAHGFALASVTAQSWLAYGYLVTLGSIVAFSAYIWLLRAVEPALAGTNSFVNPVVAVLLGWAVAGEQLSTPTLIGAALIVVAVVLVVLGRR